MDKSGEETSRPNVRKSMKEFWQEHSQKCDVTEMMLDENADVISELDKGEILMALPDLTGKEVLELGAGIGRFTGDIAATCSNLVAVDFMEKFIKKNIEHNGHHGNITFMAKNATHLSFGENRFDVVFSNWLLMYLSDDDILKLLANISTWLKPNGVLFLRESCYHQSGNKKRSHNPTIYRTPEQYEDLISTANSNGYHLNITEHGHSKTYEKVGLHLWWSGLSSAGIGHRVSS